MLTSQEIKEQLVAARRQLLMTPPSEAGGRSLLRKHTAIVDQALEAIYRLACDRARVAAGEAQSEVKSLESETGNAWALVATGGYGRGELSPYSDVDIAFVPAEEDNPFSEAAIKETFRLIVEVLMDGTDLLVGHSFRTIADCATLDHQTKTALLDARCVAGEAPLAARLQSEVLKHLDVVSFLQEKRRERQMAGPGSLYSVQPNVKEGPGGLRDLQSAFWIARVAVGEMEEVLSRGLVTTRDLRQARQAREWLWRVRNRLHLRAQRKVDVLSAEYQPCLAADFGMGLSEFMAEYYRHAEQSLRFSEQLSRALLDSTLSLDEDFQVVNQRIQAKDERVFQRHPVRLLTPFVHAHNYGFSFGHSLDTLVEGDVSLVTEETRRSREAAESFVGLLRGGSATAKSLREMARLGVLQAFLPEVGRLMRLIPNDPAHDLTVGAHSLQVVENLAELLDNPSGSGLAEEAALGVDDVEALMLAALLHDSGKGSGRDHCVVGAEKARTVGQRLRFPADRLDRMVLLVRRHLLLPRLSRLRDLNAPATLREVLRVVKDRATLKSLYLLSLADTKAVGATAWTTADLRLLDELYLKTLAAMEQDVDETVAHRAAASRRRLRAELSQMVESPEELGELAEALPASYLVNTPAATIAAHLQLLHRLPSESVIAEFVSNPDEDFSELTLCAYDDPAPGLLSKITGVLHALDANIRTATVLTLKRDPPVVLDVLWISFQGRPVPERRAERIGKTLRQVLLGEKTVDDLLNAAQKPTQTPVQVERVEASNALSDEHTTIHIVAQDAPGLLYHLTRAISSLDLDIHAAKITTWAGKAEDVFYVSRREGGKIPPEDVQDTAIKLRESLCG